MSTGETSQLWSATPRSLRDALTTVLLCLVVIGAIVPWLAIADAWRLAADPSMYPDPGNEVPRLFIVVDLIHYLPSGPSAGTALLAMAAALGLLVIAAHSSALDVATGRRRAILLVVGILGFLSMLTALARVGLLLAVMTSPPEELTEVYFGGRSGLGDVRGLLVPFAEVLGWSAVLILGVAWWRRVDGAFVGDDLEGEEDPGHHDAAGEHAWSEQPQVDRLPDVTPQERVDPARLRPDGSSDSGFDEFHFRR